MTADRVMSNEFSNRRDWLRHLSEIGRMHGFFERLGRRHSALYVQEGETLIVSFDEATRVYSRTPDGLPVGFDAVRSREWSLLNIMGSGQSWFRDPELYRFFDRLIDEDFFESFDRVLFLGCGPMCGYAAAAYSVAAPGAHVLALSPAATLDRADAPFELRYRAARRLNFTDRYGYAPFMLEGAAKATVIYDPFEVLDAAHAAQFRAPNVTRIPFRWGGPNLQAFFDRHGALLDRLALVTLRGRLTPLRFAQLTRNARRTDAIYLDRVVKRALDRGRTGLARRAATKAADLTGDPRFAAHLEALDGL